MNGNGNKRLCRSFVLALVVVFGPGAFLIAQTPAQNLALRTVSPPDSDLFKALQSRDTNAVKMALVAGAKITDKDITFACWMGQLENVKLLLDAGAEASAGLVDAAEGMHVEIVRLLLDRKADPNATKAGYQGYKPVHRPLIYDLRQEGVRPLHRVVIQDSRQAAKIEREIEIVELLLEAGADPNVVNEDGDTPLHLAAVYSKNLRMIKLLLEAGARPDMVNKQGRTPVTYARLVGARATYDWLLEQSGGKESKPRRDPNSPYKDTPAAELVRTFVRLPDEKKLSAHRELVSRGKEAMPAILKSIESGTPTETFYGVFSMMGPEAVAAMPKLKLLLKEKRHMLHAASVMEQIERGSVMQAPEEQRRAMAAVAYEAIVSAPDEQVAGSHALFLMRMREPAAQYFVKLLRSRTDKTRWFAAKMLQTPTFRDDQVRDELMKMARSEKDQSNRTRAIGALAPYRTEEVKSLLMDFIRKPPKFGEQDREARFAYDEIADSAARSLVASGPEIIDEVVPLLTPLKSPTRRYALMVLKRSGERGIPRLQALLSDDDDSIGAAAGLALGEMRSKATPALIEALGSSNEKAIERAADALWHHRSKEANLKLLELAGSEKLPDQLRITVVRTALKMDPSGRASDAALSTIPIAIRIVEEGGFREQGYAAEVLGMIGPAAREALPALRTRLTPAPADFDTGGLVHDYVSMKAKEAIAAIEKMEVETNAK